MTDEVKADVVDSTVETAEVKQDNAVTSLESALKEIARLKVISDEAIKTRDSVKRKLKEVETGYNSEKEARAKAEGQYRDMTINGALKSALQEAGAVAVDTAFKLVDKSAIQLTETGELDVESLKAVVEGIKNSDPILFQKETKATVPVARAGETIDTETAYKNELAKAKTADQIYDIMRKYNQM